MADLSFVGHGLSRPECALAHSSGLIVAPDWTGNGGVSVIFQDGSVKRHLAREPLDTGEALRPNGICLLEGGDLLLAHLGDETGGVYRLRPDGSVQPFLTHLNDEPLPPTNFVTLDIADRVWVTVSTRMRPRAAAYRSDVADGFIVLVEGGDARIVADGLGYTNECMLHPDGERLFVNETFARRLTCFEIDSDGGLSNRKTVAEFGTGTFPDGLAFDADGCAWITSIVSNRVLRVDDTGDVLVLLEDANAEHLNWVENAWSQNAMGRTHLDKAAGRRLRNISNLAFCGEGLRQAVLGCLLGDSLALLDMPVAGARPIHWTFDIAPLISALDTKPAL
ncbi:MAG: SMP-30/gluconolactonase/LRE family protein [Ahrensia sp.]|nr:SMP-30/gluconolactonase/LRE family protein [Ahrensia sp.]